MGRRRSWTRGVHGLVKREAEVLHIDQSLLNRPVNEGFSGGEKKRNEIFQMAVLDPKAGDPG
jgi:Fe-S cluster assembly ATP-binding protein